MNLKSNSGTIFFIGSTILLYLQIQFYRDTFIPFWETILIFGILGFLGFFALNRFIPYYRNESSPIIFRILHGVFCFGGIGLFVFMTSNFYFSANKLEKHSLIVVKTGRFGGRKIAHDPYVIVEFNGFEKQLVFVPELQMEGCTRVDCFLQKGCFGYYTIQRKDESAFQFKEIPSDFELLSQEINKIRAKADKCYRNEEYKKAIELYQRIISFKKDDTRAKKRIIEIQQKL